jgi:hypothetical protein
MRHPNIEKISAISRVVEGASKKCGKQDERTVRKFVKE